MKVSLTVDVVGGCRFWDHVETSRGHVDVDSTRRISVHVDRDGGRVGCVGVNGHAVVVVFAIVVVNGLSRLSVVVVVMPVIVTAVVNVAVRRRGLGCVGVAGVGGRRSVAFTAGCGNEGDSEKGREDPKVRVRAHAFVLLGRFECVNRHAGCRVGSAQTNRWAPSAHVGGNEGEHRHRMTLETTASYRRAELDDRLRGGTKRSSDETHDTANPPIDRHDESAHEETHDEATQ
jgi:hypothetical protein